MTLVVPKRHNKIIDDPYDYYAVKHNFSIVTIPCFDLIKYGSVGYVLGGWIFGVLTTRLLLNKQFDFVYSRDGYVLWILSWVRKNFLWESHEEQPKWWVKRVLNKSIGLVTLNKATQELHTMQINRQIKTLIASSGVSLNEFEIEKNKEELKLELGFDEQKKNILYAGHLYKYKGVDLLALAAKRLSQHNFYFIGGAKSDLERFINDYSLVPNIKILGHKPHNQIPKFLMAADILVLPNSGNDIFSKLYTSPIKLFEYMASGTPIIASDIPSVREVLNDQTCNFFEADNLNSLVNSINLVVNSTDNSKLKAETAKLIVKKFSYTERARKILNFLNQ